jgi:uncharacterized membrane protein YbjE (DUF340 family)
MLTVILFLASGIICGLLLRGNKKAIRLADQLTTWTIYAFLFLLGISVGVKQEIVNNIGRLGIQGFLLAVGAIVGSLCASRLVYTRFFKETEREK